MITLRDPIEGTVLKELSCQKGEYVHGLSFSPSFDSLVSFTDDSINIWATEASSVKAMGSLNSQRDLGWHNKQMHDSISDDMFPFTFHFACKLIHSNEISVDDKEWLSTLVVRTKRGMQKQEDRLFVDHT